MSGCQRSARLLKEEIDLRRPLKNKLAADKLALTAHRLDPDSQDLRGFPAV